MNRKLEEWLDEHNPRLLITGELENGSEIIKYFYKNNYFMIEFTTFDRQSFEVWRQVTDDNSINKTFEELEKYCNKKV